MGTGGLSPGFQPISAKIMVRCFDRRMAFVPEGQADRSQARSAWAGYRWRKAPSRRDGRSHGQSHRDNEYRESKRGWGWPIIFGISKLKDVFSTFLPLASSLCRDR